MWKEPLPSNRGWLIYWVGKEKIHKLVSGVEVIFSNNNKKDVIWLSWHFSLHFFLPTLKQVTGVLSSCIKSTVEFGGGDWWE